MLTSRVSEAARTVSLAHSVVEPALMKMPTFLSLLLWLNRTICDSVSPWIVYGWTPALFISSVSLARSSTWYSVPVLREMSFAWYVPVAPFVVTTTECNSPLCASWPPNTYSPVWLGGIVTVRIMSSWGGWLLPLASFAGVVRVSDKYTEKVKGRLEKLASERRGIYTPVGRASRAPIGTPAKTTSEEWIVPGS
jgi:hypothetical protein